MYGDQHRFHRDLLMGHRLLLREWAVDQGTPGPDGRRWAFNIDADDMLRQAAEEVETSPMLRVFGFDTTWGLLKAYLSVLGSAAVLTASFTAGARSGTSSSRLAATG